MQRRRIFVALPISEELQKEIFTWEESFWGLPVRWLAGKNLHITLVPPWYEENIESVKKSFAAVSGISPFEVEFKVVEHGPNPRSPRLVWAKGEAPRSVLVLKEKIEQVLHAIPEKRELLLHLTLARFRPEQFSSFPVKRLHEEIFWRDTIDSFVLMESHLSPSGADYEVLERFTLAQ